MSDPTPHVETFLQADREQQEAIARVAECGRVKMEAVHAMRAAGLTFADIGSRVGLSVPAVQRIAKKGTRP